MTDQASSLRRKMQQHKGTKAKTIAIVSGKGGVGKSNTALNMAIELQQRGNKVLLFDLDIGMGNIDILLGVYAKHTIIDMFNNLAPIQEIIEIGPKGLAYISGGSSVAEFFALSEERMHYFYGQYEMLTYAYDYIIFDLGAGVSRDSLYFTLASDECIVVTTPEPTALTDAYGMIKHIINNRSNMPIYVIMNRCRRQKECINTVHQFKQIIKRFLNRDVHLLSILPEDKFVSRAVVKQVPYIILNKNAPASKAMKQMIDQYLVHPSFTNTNIPFSFIQRIKQLMTER